MRQLQAAEAQKWRVLAGHRSRETTFALYDALTQLPPTQARRVYQHYLLGMSKAEIAAAEGVGRSRICCSIERGLAVMKNILKKSL